MTKRSANRRNSSECTDYFVDSRESFTAHNESEDSSAFMDGLIQQHQRHRQRHESHRRRSTSSKRPPNETALATSTPPPPLLSYFHFVLFLKQVCVDYPRKLSPTLRLALLTALVLALSLGLFVSSSDYRYARQLPYISSYFPLSPYLSASTIARQKAIVQMRSFDHVSFGSVGDSRAYTDRQIPVLTISTTLPSSDEEETSSSTTNGAKTIGELDASGRHLPSVSKITEASPGENQSTKLKKYRLEAQMALNQALIMQREGKLKKAAKIYRYALTLDPRNTETLTSYGEYLELHKNDVLRAEHLYARVLNLHPDHDKATINRQRALPLVNKIDRQMLDRVDSLLKKFYDIPTTNVALRIAKRDAYFMHIYHSNAIEGNTLNLQQTRHIVENRMAINGKSLIEHQEVLGLDAAMRFINDTLMYREIGDLTLSDILDIHRRVLGFCDPIESGRTRTHQVYVGSFVPPAPEDVPQLMSEFIEWLNSYQLHSEAHPIQIAALAHYKFVYIHPFYDGNGRTGRLIMNLLLMKAGYPPVIIPKEERLEYYDYLEMANQGDVKPFIRFIAKCTQRTLEEYIRMCNDSFGISVDNMNKMQRPTDLTTNGREQYALPESFFELDNDFIGDDETGPDDIIRSPPHHATAPINPNGNG